MSVREIVQHLFMKAFEPPLSKLLGDLRSVPEVLRIPILLIVFDSAVAMQGILGFLEDFGRYLVDTIDALETISAHKTAHTLRTVQRIMSNHGMTIEDLVDGGNMPDEMADQVYRETRTPYRWRPLEHPDERALDLL